MIHLAALQVATDRVQDLELSSGPTWWVLAALGLFSFILIVLGITVAVIFLRGYQSPSVKRMVLAVAVLALSVALTYKISVVRQWFGTGLWLDSLLTVFALVGTVCGVWLLAWIFRVRHVPRLNNSDTAGTDGRQNASTTQLIQHALAASPVGILVYNDSGSIVFANKRAHAVFESLNEEFIGKSIGELLDCDTAEMLDASANTDLTATRLHTLNGHTKTPSKTPVEIIARAMTVHGQEWNVASVEDISDRLETRRLLHLANQRFQRIINATKEGLWEWDIENNALWWSPTLYELLGYQNHQEPVTLMTWYDHVHPEFRQQVQDAITKNVNTGRAIDLEYLAIRKDGSERWFAMKGNTLFDDGRPLLVSGNLEDIEIRKQIEHDLDEQRSFLESIFEGVAHGIFVVEVGPEGVFRYSALNKSHLAATGIDVNDLYGKSMFDLVPRYISREAADDIYRHYRECSEAKQVTTYVEFLPFNGTDRWWKTTLYPLMRDEQVYRIVGSTTEITDLVKTEHVVRDSEQFLKKILDTAICGIYIYDFTKHRNTFINNQYTQITGYSLDDLNEAEFYDEIFHPDDVERLREHYKNVFKEHGRPVQTEYRFLHKSGQWRWVLTLEAVFSETDAGRAKELLGTFIDITPLKDNEIILKRSNEELERFACAASHDLQEPLRKIISFSTVFKEELKDVTLSGDARFAFERIVDAAKRMKRLINDLLELSQVSRMGPQREVVQLGAMVDQTREILSSQIRKHNVTIRQHNDGPIWVDPSLFQQCLQNIVINSIKYRHERRNPVISIRLNQIETEARRQFDCIELQDNGKGFSNKFKDDIFKPFKRLVNRSIYPGSGVGLSICHQIIEAHEGFIDANGFENDGALFRICVPKKPD